MTSAELLEQLKDKIGSVRGLSDAMLYRYLTRAKKKLESATHIMFQAAVGIKHSVGDKTFDLTDADIFDILVHPDDADEVCVVAEVLNVEYYLYPSLWRAPFANIRALRQYSASGGYPYLYCFHRPVDAPTLELYPAVTHAVTTFDQDDLKLTLDVLWQTPDINSDLNPMTPTYADDYLSTKAAEMIWADNGDQRFTLARSDANELFRAIKNKANKESSGQSRLGEIR